MTSVNGTPGEGGARGRAGSPRRRTAPATPNGQARRATRQERAEKAPGGSERAALLAVPPASDDPPMIAGPASGGMPRRAPLAPASARASAATPPPPSRGTAPPPNGGTATPASTGAAPQATGTRTAAVSGAELFSRHAESYAAGRPGQQVTILYAGCSSAAVLDHGRLSADGAGVSVSMIEDDQPVTRAAVAGHPSWSRCILGDLRSVPLPPRAYDIVQCSSLLERIRHAELVLDRLISAIKPGGLLLLRICDRDTAAGFLDRVLPSAVRRAIWRRRRPGEPGPYPAVYEKLVSARGIQAYAQMRGLVIAERQALGGFAGGLPPGPAGFLAAQMRIARLSRGRLTAAHEEMLYVLRKPENRFARVL